MNEPRDDDEDALMTSWRAGPGGGFLGGAAAVGVLLVAGALVYGLPRWEPIISGVSLPAVTFLGHTFPGGRYGDLRVFSRNEIPVESVTRQGQDLCWTRIGEKLRDADLLDIDVDVDYLSARTGKMQHQPTPELFAEDTREPVTSESIPPPGNFMRRTCVQLAPRITSDQPVQVRQIAYFQSVTGLYSVPVRFPNIVYPPSAAQMFAERLHDRAPLPGKGDAVAGPPRVNIAPMSYDDDRDSPASLLRSILHAGEGGGSAIPKQRLEARVPAEIAERVEQFRIAHGLKSSAAAMRALLAQGLQDDDSEALEPFDKAVRR